MIEFEFDCQRCGVRVWCAVPPAPETIYCLECRFIEGLEGDDKVKMAAIIDRINGRDPLPEGGAP